MNPKALLEELERQQIEVRLHDRMLEIKGPKGVLADALKRDLERCKTAIVEHLSNGFAGADQVDDSTATRGAYKDRLEPQKTTQPSREDSPYSPEDVQCGVQAFLLLRKMDERYRSRIPSEESL
jgi:hypothetical protein